MYRLTVETLLGLNLEGEHLRIAPCIPANGAGMDMAGRPQGMIPLMDDRREHHVEVDLC